MRASPSAPGGINGDYIPSPSRGGSGRSSLPQYYHRDAGNGGSGSFYLALFVIIGLATIGTVLVLMDLPELNNGMGPDHHLSGGIHHGGGTNVNVPGGSVHGQFQQQRESKLSRMFRGGSGGSSPPHDPHSPNGAQQQNHKDDCQMLIEAERSVRMVAESELALLRERYRELESEFRELTLKTRAASLHAGVGGENGNNHGDASSIQQQQGDVSTLQRLSKCRAALETSTATIAELKTGESIVDG